MHARAVVLRHRGGPTAALIVTDLGALLRADAAEIRRAVADAAEVPFEAATVVATHNHSMPGYAFFEGSMIYGTVPGSAAAARAGSDRALSDASLRALRQARAAQDALGGGGGPSQQQGDES